MIEWWVFSRKLVFNGSVGHIAHCIQTEQENTDNKQRGRVTIDESWYALTPLHRYVSRVAYGDSYQQ